jgi:transposase
MLDFVPLNLWFIMKENAFLGIDVSKGYADFLLLGQDKTVLEEPFQLEDTSSGRSTLEKLVQGWFSNGLKQINCGVESTGGYENNWYSFLQGLSSRCNLKVARLNPKGVKAIADAALKRTITDSVSAESIAAYLISFQEKIYYSGSWEGDREYKEARQHLSFIKMLTKQKVQLTNQLEKLLYQYFGEMLVYCRNGIPAWLLHMLTKYSVAQEVIKAGKGELVKIKGISAAKADALISKADRSGQAVNKSMHHTISITAKQILHNDELIKAERKYLTNQFKDREGVKLLQTIKGIGLDSAVSIMMEIEDISRFESAKKLCSYFGVHPTFKQSGDGTWNIKMSKKGRSEIRGILYMCGLAAIRFDPGIKKLYARFRDQGMDHYPAMGVIMHKLLRIIYGVLFNKTPYDPAVDQKNQENAESRRKQAAAQNKEILNKKNRYQKLSEHAPVSKIKNKKIKRAVSQASQMEESSDLPPAKHFFQT